MTYDQAALAAGDLRRFFFRDGAEGGAAERLLCSAAHTRGPERFWDRAGARDGADLSARGVARRYEAWDPVRRAVRAGSAWFSAGWRCAASGRRSRPRRRCISCRPRGPAGLWSQRSRSAAPPMVVEQLPGYRTRLRHRLRPGAVDGLAGGLHRGFSRLRATLTLIVAGLDGARPSADAGRVPLTGWVQVDPPAVEVELVAVAALTSRVVTEQRRRRRSESPRRSDLEPGGDPASDFSRPWLRA